jgi:hypothetical protein
MFFFGILLIVQGIYEERFLTLKNKYKIQYRFVPRSYYDEQIFSNQFASKFSNIFEEDQDKWSANQRTFTPYEIDDSKDKKITNIFGDEYTKRGLYNDNDLARVLQNIREMRMDDFRRIYGSNADKKDFTDVYGSTAENIIKKYYDSDYVSRDDYDDDDDDEEDDEEDYDDDEEDDDDDDDDGDDTIMTLN